MNTTPGSSSPASIHSLTICRNSLEPQAQSLLETEAPDAAAMVASAISLLQSGAADAQSISTLISTARGML